METKSFKVGKNRSIIAILLLSYEADDATDIHHVIYHDSIIEDIAYYPIFNEWLEERDDIESLKDSSEDEEISFNKEKHIFITRKTLAKGFSNELYDRIIKESSNKICK